jgi:hypothetical protein
MPRRFVPVIVVATIALAACGQSNVGGDGGGGGADLPTTATASSEDAEGTTYPLAPGRYRLEWSVEGCAFPTIVITDASGSFRWEQSPRLRIIFVDDVPGGDMTIQQTNAECTSWEINLLEF